MLASWLYHRLLDVMLYRASAAAEGGPNLQRLVDEAEEKSEASHGMIDIDRMHDMTLSLNFVAHHNLNFTHFYEMETRRLTVCAFEKHVIDSFVCLDHKRYPQDTRTAVPWLHMTPPTLLSSPSLSDAWAASADRESSEGSKLPESSTSHMLVLLRLHNVRALALAKVSYAVYPPQSNAWLLLPVQL